MDKLIYILIATLFLSCAGTKSSDNGVLSYEERNRLFNYQKSLKALEILNDDIIKAVTTNSCSQEWEKKVKKLKESLYLSPDNKKSTIWYELGNCYLYIQDFKKALFYYELTESSGTKDTKIIASLYYNIGVSYFSVGQLELAKSYFELAKKKDDPKSLSYFQLGLIDLSNGDFRSSLRNLSTLSRRYPQSRLINYLLGVNYFYLRDIKSLRNKVLNRLDEKFFGKALLEVAIDTTSEQKRAKVKNDGVLDRLESEIIYFEKFRLSLLKEIEN